MLNSTAGSSTSMDVKGEAFHWNLKNDIFLNPENTFSLTPNYSFSTKLKQFSPSNEHGFPHSLETFLT